MAWRFKGCKRCTGDLVLVDAEWRCFQCGRYYFLRNAEVYEPSWDVRKRLMDEAVLASDPQVETGVLVG